MDNLPKGWIISKLENLVKIRTGKLDSNAMVKDGQYPFFTCSREVFAIDEYAFDCEAILLAGNNASGDFNVKYYNGKFNAYQRTYVITINHSQEILYPYLKLQLISNLRRFKEQSVGANTKFLKIGMIYGMEIPLPPLPEQTRIVNKLDSLFERIDKSIALLEENIKHTEALMASVLEEVFGGMEDSLFKPILEVCSIYNKTINPKDGEVYNYVGLENIESVTGRLVDFSPSTGESIKSSKVIFGSNAVLYGKLRPYLNKVWVSNFEGVSTTEILPFKPNNKILNSNYLAYYLRSPKFVNLVNSNTSGARMPRATTGFFKTIAKVPIPELEIQESIVLKLDAISNKSTRLISEQQSKLNYLKALKASLLDKAFKGEL